MKIRNGARRGTSLIEILVVLVILVFGILSVIRLFPAGFLVFRAAQNTGVGQRIGQSLLESITKDTSAIADGIYIYDDGLGYFDPTIAPDDLTAWKTNPTKAGYDDINKARFVRNETVVLPEARDVAPVNGAYTKSSLHVLNYGPIIVNATNGVSVISSPWAAQVGNSLLTGDANSTPIDQPADLLASGQPQYLIDYDAAQIAVPVESYARNFQFSVMTDYGVGTYSFTEAAAAGNTWQPITLTGVPTTAKWIAGTAVLYRQFKQLAGGQQTSNNTNSQFDADPYEFQLRYDSIGPDGVNYGVLDFNPLAGGGNGVQPLTARISYVVYNWHILHEDHTLPYKSEDRTVRLGIDNLKKIGDVQHDQTLFKGLFNSTSAGDAAEVMVCNLDTGASKQLDSISGSAYDLDGDSTPTSGVGVSYKNGRLSFPLDNEPAYTELTPTPNSGGVHIRLYYMGSADWGVALQKAPASYFATANNTDLVTPSVRPVNTYYALVSNPPSGGILTVQFPLCDYGKTVEISGVMTYTTTDPTPVQTTAAIPTLTSAINTPATINSKSVGQMIIRNLVVPANCDLTKPVIISSVRGVSANALVVWRENDQWKHRSVDTLLPRN